MWNQPWPHPPIQQSILLSLPSEYIHSLFLNHSCCFHYDLCHHHLPPGLFAVASDLVSLLPPLCSPSSLEQVMTLLHHSRVKVKDLNVVPICSLTSSSTTYPLFIFLQPHCYSSIISSVLPQGLCTYCPLCPECSSSTWPCGFSSLFSSGIFLTMSSSKEAKSHHPI